MTVALIAALAGATLIAADENSTWIVAVFPLAPVSAILSGMLVHNAIRQR